MTLPDEPDLPLATEFPTATREQWRRMVAAVLAKSTTSAEGGPADEAAPEHRLRSVMRGGVVVEPLYTRDDAGGGAAPGLPGLPPFTRGRLATGHRQGWDVRQQVAHPDPRVAGRYALEELEGGAGSVWLGLGPAGTPLDGLDEVLSGVYLDLATVILDAGGLAPEAAAGFLRHATDRGVPDSDLRGCLGFDPVGVRARTGARVDMGEAVSFAQRCLRTLPTVTALVVDGLAFHDAGATDVQELGATVAAGVEYLRALEAAGVPPGAALGQLEFRYAATADQFATIAKLRAARQLWGSVARACGVPEAGGQRQHVVSSWSMFTRRDPWNNILRGTLACLSAGVAGADSVTVLPFDAALGLPDGLARRVARNTHALLIDESNVAKVIDPAGGSWYVESLTRDLARRAWTLFQEIERAGGMLACLDSGMVADRIAESRAEGRAAVADGRAGIVGVSVFPQQDERLLPREPGPGEGVAADGTAPEGLPRLRWAQWHERLRDRSDAYAEATGVPPEVLLVPVDGASAAARRVTAALGPAGVRATVVATERLAEAPPARVPTVALLCCDRDPDDEEMAAAVGALRDLGVVRILLASTPGSVVTAVAGVAVVDNTDALSLAERVLDEVERRGG